MCYQVNPKTKKTQVEKEARKKIVWEKTVETPKIKVSGFDFPELDVLIEGGASEEIIGTTAKWGLIPGWLNSAEKANELRPMTLNAKIETAISKPSFKDSVSNRCLIPVAGFFEWRHEGKEKYPYYIYPGVGNVFFFAGLFSNWTHPENGISETNCTFLTTEANDTMQFIHNTKQRMPVILHPDQLVAYLNPDVPLAHFSKGCTSEWMLSYTVNRQRMKNVQYENDVLLLEEHVYDKPVQGTLF